MSGIGHNMQLRDASSTRESYGDFESPLPKDARPDQKPATDDPVIEEILSGHTDENLPSPEIDGEFFREDLVNLTTTIGTFQQNSQFLKAIEGVEPEVESSIQFSDDELEDLIRIMVDQLDMNGEGFIPMVEDLPEVASITQQSEDLRVALESFIDTGGIELGPWLREFVQIVQFSEEDMLQAHSEPAPFESLDMSEWYHLFMPDENLEAGLDQGYSAFQDDLVEQTDEVVILEDVIRIAQEGMAVETQVFWTLNLHEFIN